jgi:hypothetical protein
MTWQLTGRLQPLVFRQTDDGPAKIPARRVAAGGGSVCDENLQSMVFGPSERNGGVSFAKK